MQFSDVTFGYLRSDPVLKGLDLTVAPGNALPSSVASGSDVDDRAARPRFYDVAAGSVRIDGVDVHDVTFQSLRSQVGVVFEDSFLFSDACTTTSRTGSLDATDAELEAAAREAEPTTSSPVPAGYDTVVGERGLPLSGGQRRRLAFAPR